MNNIGMPNHVHVIVIIDKMDDGRGGNCWDDPYTMGGRNGLGGKNAINRVSKENRNPGFL